MYCWLASAPMSAQTANFTVAASQFNPFAIDPRANAVSTVTVTPGTGFSGTVDLSCAVTPTASAPSCQLSPLNVAPPATSGLTLSGLTSSGAPAQPGTYNVMITGTQGPATSQVALNVTVLSVAPGFTVTVVTQILPTSVHAGSGATAQIAVTPIADYVGNVTLACATITPLVYPAPVCSFTYSDNPNLPYAQVRGAATPAMLTISTSGPINLQNVSVPRKPYLMWFPTPVVALAGIGAGVSRKGRRKMWGLLGLLLVAGIFLFLPGCGTNTGNQQFAPKGLTPKGTYTFTLTGTDNSGAVAANGSTANSAATVTLIVN